jgi:hypothetical protein
VPVHFNVRTLGTYPGAIWGPREQFSRRPGVGPALTLLSSRRPVGVRALSGYCRPARGRIIFGHMAMAELHSRRLCFASARRRLKASGWRFGPERHWRPVPLCLTALTRLQCVGVRQLTLLSSPIQQRARKALPSASSAATTQSRCRGDFPNRRQRPAIGGLSLRRAVSEAAHFGLKRGRRGMCLCTKNPVSQESETGSTETRFDLAR